MNKSKILVIENSIAVTGALKSVIRSSYVLKEYFDFKFILPSNSKGRSWIEGRSFNDIIEFPLREINRRMSSWLLYFPILLINAFRLKAVVSRERISLIHVNDVYNLLPVALRLWGNTTPYICHVRFLPDRFPRWLFIFWLRLHLRYSAKIIAVSQSVLSQLPSHPKIALIYNELPVIERYPRSLPDQAKLSFTFLFLSNFIEGKGQNFALQAFAQIHHDLPNWKLRFVGGDMGLKKNQEYRSALAKQAETLGILNKTEWIGFTDDVELEYKQADIVLNFSESESFSITCLDALFFGRPVIASNSGGPVEIIDHGKSGLIVPNRDVERMSKAMKQLADDKILRDKMGVSGHQLLREKFSFENTSAKLKEVYLNCMISHEG